MSQTIYLKIEFSTGNFYERSKDPKEGFEKFTSTKDNTYYRKMYTDAIYGSFKSIELRDSNFGKEMSLKIHDRDKDIWYQIDFGLKGVSGEFSDWAESLLQKLPNMEPGLDYAISAYNFVPEDSKTGRKLIGFSIKKDGEKIPNAFTYAKYDRDTNELIPGDVPPLVWVEKLGSRKPTAASKEAIEDFFIGVLEEQKVRFKPFDRTENTERKDVPAEVADGEPDFPEFAGDDLPF